MPINDVQRKALEEVLAAVNATTGPNRGKRKLADMFQELPDRDAWSEYYEVRASRFLRDVILFELVL